MIFVLQFSNPLILVLLLAIFNKQGELNVTGLSGTLDILLTKRLSEEEAEMLVKAEKFEWLS